MLICYVMKVCADQLGLCLQDFPFAFKHTCIARGNNPRLCPLPKNLDNLMTFDQWRSHISLLNAWKDLYVTN